MHSTLQTCIDEAQNIVFFGGAGVSTESGIPDFRSADGLYNRNDFPYPPEQMLSRSFFDAEPEAFFDFYKKVLLQPNIGPSCIHYALTKLEEKGKLLGIITQNIDGLHQQSGSRNVLELHGSVLRNYCMHCHQFFPTEYVQKAAGIPYCPKDGGIIKPDVVLYEESLDSQILSHSIALLQKADLLIIGGTSLVVYPAASLIDYFRGSRLVIINKDATPQDNNADLVIRESLSKALCE